MAQLTLQSWHRQFIKALFHYSTEKMNIEKAFMIKHPHVPNYLYKYRNFNKNHLKALEQNVLWTSSADRLNDPYDCAIYYNAGTIKTENLPKEEFFKNIESLKANPNHFHQIKSQPIKDPISHSEYLEKIIDELLSENPSPDNQKIKEVFLKIQDNLLDEILRSTNNFVRSGTGVLSLSETPLEHLMWAHYGDSFKGFTIEYNFQSLTYNDIARRMCFPVFYTKKSRNATRYLPKHIGANFNNLFGSYTALMKDHAWAYEREWRILSMLGHDYANGPFKGLPKPSSIIMGSQVSDENKNWMINFCSHKNIKVKFLKENLKNRSLQITE